MTRETRQRIKEAILAADRRKHPNMPLHTLPQPKVQETSANALTKTIIEFLRAEGWQAERINTMGRYLPGQKQKNCWGATVETKGKYIPTTGQVGSADISATIKGRSVKIEVKYGKDRQSEAQRAYQANIEQAGGIYFIARDLDTFLIDYDKILAL